MSIDRVMTPFSDAEIGEATVRLESAGVTVVAGTMLNAAGLSLAKLVPLKRLGAFARSGLGASPTWNIFCIDGGIAFTPALGVVGDLRLRLDLDALRILDDGLAWAPTELFDQNGAALPVDPRGRLRLVQSELEDAGLETLVGHELEFVLTAADGSPFARPQWTPYGLGPALDHEAFFTELIEAAAQAGLELEQVHAEHAPAQFEFSLPPAPPLEAADGVVLARLLIGRIGRKHGLRASFSPFPFAGGEGSGAHLHFSFGRSGESLFSGGGGPYGIGDDGGAAIAGVVAGLPGIQGVLAGSILSGARLRPGYWSGAYACWGRENREAAVRFIEATPGNPRGANVEVKVVDPSANPYLASAAVLGAALDGIRSHRRLPAEVAANPAEQSEADAVATSTILLPSDLATVLDALDGSAVAESVLGRELVEVVLAVRRYELLHFSELPAEELSGRFRHAWSS